MAIESVTSSLSAYMAPGMQPGQTQQGGEASRTVETREPRPEERVERTEEPQRPVVNAQGQQTGTLINITA